MSNTLKEPSIHAQLRQKAEASIRGGSAPATHGWSIGAAPLALLHRLASDPASASDALKLLHELQVHQVELDLQHEYMDEERLAQEQSTQQLADLYAFAPVAYFMVTATGQVMEGNFAAARLLGIERDDLASCNISQLAAPDSQSALLALFKQALTSSSRHNCRIQAFDTTRFKYLEVIASSAPGGQHCLVVVVEVNDISVPSPQT